MEKEKKIYVFADFLSFSNELVGTMYVSQTRGKEFYSFEYNEKWLENKKMLLDPDLQLYKGRQYITDEKNIFGVFADSCPDRWGRRLMKRREEIRAKKEGLKPEKLLESDYLLGVYDEARMGGLRFKTELEGNFLSDDKDSDCSKAGTRRLQKEAATITPAANPVRAFCSFSLILSFRTYTMAAPREVPRNGISIPITVFIYI